MKSISNAKSITQNDIDLLKSLKISEVEMFEVVRSASHMFVVNTLFDTFKIQDD